MAEIDDDYGAQMEQRPGLDGDRHRNDGAVAIDIRRLRESLGIGVTEIQLRLPDGRENPRIVIAGAPKRVDHRREIRREPLRQSLSIRRRIQPQFVKARTVLESVLDAAVAQNHEFNFIRKRRRRGSRGLLRPEKPEKIEG